MTEVVLKMIEEAKELTPGERHDLEEALRRLDKQATEDDVMRGLAAEGIVTMPSRTLSPTRPLAVSGKPVSEILIEERR